jgi:mannose-6-phosphate isomerase-like protein (cupin superfamily)
MAGFIINIEEATEQNDNYRQVLHTAYYGQLILMSLLPGEETGAAVNDLDQFIRIESGHGKVILDGEEHTVGDNWVVVIPAGVEHNVINTSDKEKMKLYSIYTPPEHLPGTVHPSKADDLAHRY